MQTFLKLSMVLCLCISMKNVVAQNLFVSKSGRIDFVSEAPLELIKAHNESFKFLIDTVKKEFAISIPIGEFNGFNSALQREHFFENYMEIEKFRNATFTGKILDNLNYRPDPFVVLVRGELHIHGVKKERIIEAECEWINQEQLRIIASFKVPLADHNIEIPRIVYQKIAEVIDVAVEADLFPKN